MRAGAAIRENGVTFADGWVHMPRRAQTIGIVFSRTLFLIALSLSVMPIATIAAAPPPTGAVATSPPGVTYVRRLGGPPAPPAPAPPRVGQPVRLKAPTIFLDAAVQQVGLAPDGAMDVPSNFEETAWYQPGARPGEPGNAVIDGHVDSQRGKAVFYDLRKLARGDEIIVVGDDNVERRFTVMETAAYPRDEVPLARVFGPTTGTHLNLITCDATSAFDRSHGEYAGNLIVYAEAAGKP
jgi:hypothetical protein